MVNVMKFDGIDVISPKLFPNEYWNEAEALGAITWLWLHSDNYKNAPVKEMAARALPSLKNGQFALLSRKSQPVGYITWAYFNQEAETRYLQSDQLLLANQDWQSGERLWLINWFAPFGNSKLIKFITGTYLFPTQCGRSLYHKGDVHGLRIMTFKGDRVSVSEKAQWVTNHPIVYPSKNKLK